MIITQRVLLIYAFIIIGLSFAGLAVGYHQCSLDMTRMIQNDISNNKLSASYVMTDGDKLAVTSKEMRTPLQ
jgi:hypothetical protein